MKKILMFSTVALIGIAAFTGCKKSDSSSPASSLKASIDNGSYSSTNCTATVSSGIIEIYTNIAATGITYPTISLQVNNYNGVGTYTLGSGSTTEIFTVDSSASSASASTASVAGGSGTITITSATTSVVSGTFNFTCIDGTTVTGGSFTANVN